MWNPWRPAFLVSTFAVALLASAHQQDETLAPSQRVERVQDLVAIAEPQRSRARFFDVFGEPISGPGVRHYGAELGTGLTDFSGDHAPTALEQFATNWCSADLVVVGVPSSARAYLNWSKTYLFTDYSISVDRWLRGSSSNEASVVGSTFGGSVLLNGRLLTTVDPRVPLLRVGSQYLFSLYRISRIDISAGYTMWPSAIRLEPSERLPSNPFDSAAAAELVERVTSVLSSCRNR